MPAERTLPMEPGALRGTVRRSVSFAPALPKSNYWQSMEYRKYAVVVVSGRLIRLAVSRPL